MTSEEKFLQEFTKQYTKIDFENYYKLHTNAETYNYFNITKRQLSSLKKYWNIANKPTFNDFLQKTNKEEFEFYYRTHSNEEVFTQYAINHNMLNSIRKAWDISPKTIEEQKAINLRIYGVEFTGQRSEVIQNIKQAKQIKTVTYVDIISQFEPADIQAYLTNHSTEEACNYYNTTYDNIKKVRKELGIAGKTQQEKEIINLRRFGVKNVFQLESVKEKSKQTLQNRYGVTNIGQTVEQKAKSYQTKKKNHSFNTSKPEDCYYEYLKEKYGEADVVRQYRDEIRYPYNCDFYIKSQDLFIELNLTWSHGEHKYSSDCKEDKLKADLWAKKAETSEYYANALFVWTIRDPEKFACANKNHLNYRVYYSEEELYLN